MNKFRFTFNNGVTIERVFDSLMTESAMRQSLDLDINAGWVEGVTSSNTYTISNEGTYTPDVNPADIKE